MVWSTYGNAPVAPKRWSLMSANYVAAQYVHHTVVMCITVWHNCSAQPHGGAEGFKHNSSDSFLSGSIHVYFMHTCSLRCLHNPLVFHGCHTSQPTIIAWQWRHGWRCIMDNVTRTHLRTKSPWTPELLLIKYWFSTYYVYIIIFSIYSDGAPMTHILHASSKSPPC